jgi:hypothetical protein
MIESDPLTPLIYTDGLIKTGQIKLQFNSK